MNIPAAWSGAMPEWMRRVALTVNDMTGRTQYVGTVAKLPTGSQGMRGFVTDATATAFYGVVAGGGANKVPVFHDGSSWRIG